MGNDKMCYTLMHREVPVAEIVLNPENGWVQKIGEVYDEAHVPVGVSVKKGQINRRELNEWWRGRGIPASRDAFYGLLESFGVATTELLAERCYGLSLSDQYWICPENSGLKWSEINFFENTFSEDVGNILFGRPVTGQPMSLVSPDNTSDGWLKKKWKIVNDRRCLIKGGSGLAQQEPYNEALAAKIMERLSIPHVGYSVIEEKGYPFSICEDFITPDTELVTAWYLMQTRKKENHVSVYQHYVNCCEEHDIPDIQRALDEMLVVDYIILNEDRHQNNFGVVRDAKTLTYRGAAPIFDSGTSFWWDTPTSRIGSLARVGCKPFKKLHEEQIKLVNNFDWLDLSKLRGIEDEFREIVRNSEFLDEVRIGNLCTALRGRINQLQSIIDGGITYSSSVDNLSMDVRENIAYHGKS